MLSGSMGGMIAEGEEGIRGRDLILTVGRGFSPAVEYWRFCHLANRAVELSLHERPIQEDFTRNATQAYYTWVRLLQLP
jgi:hypothetical protein